MCVLISFIHNLGLTIKPIKGPPQGVYACPHNGLPLGACMCARLDELQRGHHRRGVYM
eukprot:SAG25_NODE_15_length_24441_cov_175.207288_10_plen_58_part_00